MSQRTLQLGACILAIALVLVNFAPQGMSVCIQSSGEVFTGVGCHCDTSQEPGITATCQDGCCGTSEEVPQMESRCCICLQLQLASVIPSAHQILAQQTPVDCPSSANIVIFPKANCFGSMLQYTILQPPPLLRTAVLRI